MPPQVTSEDCRRHTHVVDQQLVLLVLSSKLADQQLHETLEGGGHIHVLVLQLDVRTLLLHFLNQPGHQRDTRGDQRGGATLALALPGTGLSPHLTTSMEAAPALKKSVVSSMAGTLLRIPFQMFCDERTQHT